MSHNILMILVMAFPMLLFSVYPALKVGEYLEKNYEVSESKKRSIISFITVLVALIFSSILNLT